MESIPELNQNRPRSCWLEVNLDALRHNLNQVQQQLSSDSSLLAVVKAEAYGHGAEMVSETLANEGVDFLGVATLEEGIKLRDFGIDTKILIMGHMATFNVDALLDYDFTPFVFSYRLLHALNEAGKNRGRGVPIHLKVDTGMGRLGILPDDADEFLEEIQSLDYINLEGVASHFAQAGENKAYTDSQIEQFKSLKETVLDMGFSPDHWHCMNSAAIFSRSNDVGNTVRPGITLYGYQPNESLPSRDLQPIMQVKTKMADYKQVPAGRGVSYGRRFKPEEPTWVGVLPLGYADGYAREFSQKAHVLKDGRKCPVLGSVCMDMTMIQLSEKDDPEQTVTVMGTDGELSVWADQLARWNSTITYEILCSFSERLPRIYRENGESIALKTERTVKRL
ncbi:MAG: alanine racemase [bacterium]